MKDPFDVQVSLCFRSLNRERRSMSFQDKNISLLLAIRKA